MPEMGRSQTYRAEGIVLGRRDLGDADRIVTLFTREFGRRRLVARGSRRPASHLAPSIELFNRVRILGVVGSSLDILSQVEELESHPRLRTDLAAFAAAGWCVELLDGLSEDNEPSLDAYDAVLTFLRGLDLSSDPPELWLTALALILLQLHGYSPEFGRCTACGQPLQPGDHRFASTAGGVVCRTDSREHESRPLSVAALKVLRYLAREGFHAASRLRVDANVRAEVRDLLRAYSSTILERDVKSARMLTPAAPGKLAAR